MKNGFMERWFPISTKRLVLREYMPADEEAIYEYASDPLVSRYDSWGPNNREESAQHVRRRLAEQQNWPRNDVTRVAELSNDRKAIGSVRLWLADEANQTAEIGYTFPAR